MKPVRKLTSVLVICCSANALSAVTVTDFEALSQSPLEMPVPAIPNVMLLLDDTVEGMQTDLLTNDTEDVGQEGAGGRYIHNNDIKTWVMPYGSGSSHDYAPTEASDPDSGLWRLRNSSYNRIYYDPGVEYKPWSGSDANNLAFGDADPANAHDDPYNPEQFYDLTATHTLGSGNIPVNYYWTWTDHDSDGVVDVTESGMKVDITRDNAPFTGGTDRTDCTGHVNAPVSCTYEEEIQNFANWFSYHRTRSLVAKAGLGQVIADARNLRVGFAGFNGQSNVTGVKALNNSELTGHKAHLLANLYGVTHSAGDNNMRTALLQTGKYFACESQAIINEASGKAPGETGCPVPARPVGNCQQNIALVVSAGFWGGEPPGVEADSGRFPDADDTVFDGGRYADTTRDTLADVAMYFYERDLHPDLIDEVPTGLRDLNGVPQDERRAAFSGTDNATDTMHQHMKTYIIGFGAQGDITFDAAEARAVDFNAEAIDFWGDPERSDNDKLNDLVHAALNGRGAYLDAGNPPMLKAALTSAFEKFSNLVGTATAVEYNAGEVLGDSLIYRASFNFAQGTGDLVAETLDIDSSGLISPGEVKWSASQQLDARPWDSRIIFTWDPIRMHGIPFRYSELNPDQRAALAAALTLGEEDEVTRLVNYLRGDSTSEWPDGPFGDRPEVRGRLGDIVNSTPAYYGKPNRNLRTGSRFPQMPGFTYPEFARLHAGRQDMVYVAANDGLFHAFNAGTGYEEWAFVPDSVIQGSYSNQIGELASVNNPHRLINDLTPTIEDVFIDGTGLNSAATRNWMTIVIGGLGAGGKGYYALNITEPVPGTGNKEADTAALVDKVLWEFTDGDDTYPTCERPKEDECTTDQGLVDDADSQLVDTSMIPAKAYRDLGFSLSQPVIAMSNLSHSDGEHEWVVVFGNGYNSSSGRAKLYILRIERGIDGHWCHPDRVFDGNERSGDHWDHTLQSNHLHCPGGADFVKIEASGPVNIPLDGNNDGDLDDVADNPDRVLANGLGSPRGIDINRDGTLDYAYAGDRFGNLYRFDLSSDDVGDWGVELLFQASYTEEGMDSYTQPVTTRPFAVKHPTAVTGADCDPNPDVNSPCGGLIIIFATGSLVYADDVTDRKISSIYGIWERFQAGAGNRVIRSDLVEQAFAFTDATHLTRTLTSNPVDYSQQGDMGYFIDLDTPSYGDPSTIVFAGEKAIRNFHEISGVIYVNSVIPRKSASCTGRARGAQIAFCAGTGGLNCVGQSPLFDVNDDGNFDEEDQIEDGSDPASLMIEDGFPADAVLIEENRLTQSSGRTVQNTLVNPGDTGSTGRLSWKQLH